MQTFIRKGLPGAGLLLLHEVCPAGEDKTRVALAVAVQTVASAMQSLATESQKLQTLSSLPLTNAAEATEATPSAAGAGTLSRFNITCASAMLFLSLAGGNTSSFSKTINIMKYWSSVVSSTAAHAHSHHTVSLSIICRAVCDSDEDDAQVVARWLSDAVIEDARERHLDNVTQASAWRLVVEWTQVTGCFVCQRVLDQLITAGDWGNLMLVAHDCGIHPQIIWSFTSACAPDSVQKTCVPKNTLWLFGFV